MAPSVPVEDVVPHVCAAQAAVYLVDVDVHRGRELGVPEPSLNLLQRLPAREQERTASLPERVERDALIVP